MLSSGAIAGPSRQCLAVPRNLSSISGGQCVSNALKWVPRFQAAGKGGTASSNPATHQVNKLKRAAKSTSLLPLACLPRETTSPFYSPPPSTGPLSQPQYSSFTPVDHSPKLVLSTGVFMLPHPDKVLKGGEDWYFIADHQRAIGVADGVGGWAEIGVDAGAYARQLMNAAKVAAEAGAASSSGSHQPDLSPQTILEKAYQKTDVRGSSTACVLVLNGDQLQASNLGDSGFLLLRDGKVQFHSPQQQHAFNFPFQIGSFDSMGDSPSASEKFDMFVSPGDIIVVGTDGLWDNCFDDEIVAVIKYCKDSNMDPDKSAQVMAHYARHRASNSKYASPFAHLAFQAGFSYMGGKMDDITVLVAFVTQTARL